MIKLEIRYWLSSGYDSSITIKMPYIPNVGDELGFYISNGSDYRIFNITNILHELNYNNDFDITVIKAIEK